MTIVDDLYNSYPDRMIQYYGFGAEERPEWVDNAIDLITSHSVEIFRVGFPYYVEGEEAIQLLYYPQEEKGYWVVHWYYNVAEGQASVGVFKTLRKALDTILSFINDWIEKIKEIISEEKEDKRMIEWYRRVLSELREWKRKIKKLEF